VATPSYLPANQLSPITPQEEEFLTPEIIEDESVALEDRERVAIARALERRHGNRKLAAADLHISERTLYRKLKEYSIE
jgi:transcriptional regulator with PAS, ATPase and Fis domain